MNRDQDKVLAKMLVRAQSGDQDEYKKFLREVSSILKNFLAKKLKSSDVVDDILQETLLAIHRGRHSYIPGRPLTPWIYAICDYRIADYFRKTQRRNQLLDALKKESSKSTTSENLMTSLMFETLEKLPKKQRLVIEKLKLHDLSIKEIASETGMSESAVKVTASRGYETMRRILGVKQK